MMQTNNIILSSIALLFLGLAGCTKENICISMATIAGLQASDARSAQRQIAQILVALGVAGNCVVLSKTGVTKLYEFIITNYGFLDYWDVPDNELAYNPATAGSAAVKNPKQ